MKLLTRSNLIRFASLSSVALALVLFLRPQLGLSQTATEAYIACTDAAAVRANNCYMTSDGILEKWACDRAWDIDNWACRSALARALKV